MARLVTVYEARPEDVAQIVGMLESRHLHPVVPEDVGRRSAYRRGSSLVQIAVPETERDMAIGVLAEFERQEDSRLKQLTKVTDSAMLFVIVVLAFVAVVGILDAEGKWHAALWGVLCLIASVAVIRAAWARKGGE